MSNQNNHHYEFYLKENYREEPKEYYKFCVNELNKDLADKNKEDLSFLDIGCETGSFLHYLRKCYPDARLTGIDVVPEMIELVNKPDDINAETIIANVADSSTLPDKKYDAVFMSGLLSIFDDFELIIENMMTLVKKNCYAYIFEIFNPIDLDVIIKARLSRGRGEWVKGWNNFSIDSVSAFLDERDLSYEFIPFEMPFAIPKHEEDPLRSWTVKYEDKLGVINGTQIIHNFYLLKIKNGK